MNEHEIRAWLFLTWGNDKHRQLDGVKDLLKNAAEDGMTPDDRRECLVAKALLECELC